MARLFWNKSKREYSKCKDMTSEYEFSACPKAQEANSICSPKNFPGNLFNPGNVKLNQRAGWLHFCLFIFIIVMIGQKEPPFVIKFKKMWAPGGNLPPANSPLSSSICNGKNYSDPNEDGDTSDSSVFDWFECVRDVYQDEQTTLCNACKNGSTTQTLVSCSIYDTVSNCADNFKIRDDARYNTKDTDALTNAAVLSDGDLGEIKVAYLLLVFEFITFMVHFALGQERCDDNDPTFYEELLKQQLQPFRWLEYSITASIMLWCALSLSRVQEQFLLISLFVNSFYLNFVGGAMFEVCAWVVRKSDSKESQDICVLRLHNADRKGNFKINMKTLFHQLQWICFFSAWVSYAIVLWTSFDAMYSIIEPYTSNINTGVLWSELFDVVMWVNTGIFVTYSCFPLIHLYVFWPWKCADKKKNIARYNYGETLYIYASFIAKTTLVVTIGYAAFMRED